MRSNRSLFFCTVSVLLAVAGAALAGYQDVTPKYKILHSFDRRNDGAALWGSLLLDDAGNVYGTTYAGGPGGGGTVFKLTPEVGGKWSYSLVFGFGSSPPEPGGSSAGLILDPAGNLYGTTAWGGEHGYGAVFELTPQSAGWQETVLYSFPPPGPEGCCPYGGVVRDPAGNLYGTAGVAFEISQGTGGWQGTVLHTFPSHSGDGSVPFAGPILDAAGNLYGTTEHGGKSQDRCDEGCGTVYKLAPQPDGTWTETILHNFHARGDGAFPGVGALILDGSGNLYGTADGGGATGYGVVFKLSATPAGPWKETVLYNITGGADGDHPAAGVVMDQAGNLYGTTIAGGDANCGCGVVFKLAPRANGHWKYTVLHRFTGYDGAEPDANLVLDSQGNLYGTTATAGPGGYGVVFEVSP
jgi:uncharacterized repeat protein (TIGR03803 family)